MVDIGADRCREAPEDALALLRLHAPPGAALEAVACGADRRRNILRPAACHRADAATIDRADVLEYPAVAGGHGPAGDEGAPLRPLARREALPGTAVARGV